MVRRFYPYLLSVEGSEVNRLRFSAAFIRGAALGRVLHSRSARTRLG